MDGDQIRALHFAVKWLDQHPLTWLEDAFPATYDVDGWTLTLTDGRLDAAPTADVDEEQALDDLLPRLDAWRAVLEVEHRLIVVFDYLGADLERREPVEGRASADFAGVQATAYDATVAIERGTPPGPDPLWRDTEWALDARLACLRPVRDGSRQLADAAYWLVTHLHAWSKTDLAARLNVSGKYLAQVSKLSGGSPDRKVMKNPRRSSDAERAWLRDAVEELVRRLHLAESGQDPGPYLDLSDAP